MRLYSIPPRVTALVFDIDNTLYRNDRYCELQVELLVRRFAATRHMGEDEAKGLIARKKRVYEQKNGGRKTSTGNIMLELGVPLEENARWRDALFAPEDHLRSDPKTVESITTLRDRFATAAVTNNTVRIADRTLAVLGLDGVFDAIVGLDTCFVSKPAAEPFLAALERIGASSETAVSIGDRYDVDLEVPLSLGMGGVLVETLEDLHRLPVALIPYENV